MSDNQLANATSTAVGFVPVLGEITMAAQAGAMGAEVVLGEENYGILRTGGPWIYAAGVGFVPIINPIFMIVQIPMFILFAILLIWLTNLGWYAIPVAWCMQALIIMFTFHWIFDSALVYGVGI